MPAPDPAAILKLLVMPIANRQFFRFLEQRIQKGECQRGQCLLSTLRKPGPWGTGPHQIMAGEAQFGKQTDHIVLEAYRAYWDTAHVPRVQRLVFDHSMTPQESVRKQKVAIPE